MNPENIHKKNLTQKLTSCSKFVSSTLNPGRASSIFKWKSWSRFFIIKIYYIYSSNDPNITHTKNHIWGYSHFKLLVVLIVFFSNFFFFFQFPELNEEYFKLITFVCEEHTEAICQMPDHLFTNLMASLEKGLKEYPFIGRVTCIRQKKKICGFPVSSYKNLGRVGRF
jgi:hypothetical protein